MATLEISVCSVPIEGARNPLRFWKAGSHGLVTVKPHSPTGMNLRYPHLQSTRGRSTSVAAVPKEVRGTRRSPDDAVVETPHFSQGVREVGHCAK